MNYNLRKSRNDFYREDGFLRKSTEDAHFISSDNVSLGNIALLRHKENVFKF
jgi:hypothetical protein